MLSCSKWAAASTGTTAPTMRTGLHRRAARGGAAHGRGLSDRAGERVGHHSPWHHPPTRWRRLSWEGMNLAGDGFVFHGKLRLCGRRGVPADVGRRHCRHHVRHRHRSPSRNGLPSPRRAPADGTIRDGVQRNDGRHRGRLRGVDEFTTRDRHSVGAIRESPLWEVIFRVISVSIGTASGWYRRARGRHSWGR